MNRPAVSNLLSISTWTPGQPKERAPNAPPIPNEVWDHHRDEIVNMYIQLDWKLDDVMHVMEDRFSFSATKRQYTKMLREWGCRKYNLHLKVADTASVPSSAVRIMPSQIPSNTLPMSPMRCHDDAFDAAPRSTPRELHETVGAVAVTRFAVTHPGTMDDAPATKAKATTAKGYVAVIGGDDRPWTEDMGAMSAGFPHDPDIMDGAMVAIPEERSASSLSKIDDASVEEASIGDYSSVSSVNLTFGTSKSLQKSPNLSPKPPASPVQKTAFVFDLWSSVIARYKNAEKDVLLSAQDVDTTDAYLDWDMAESIAVVEGPIHELLPASEESITYPVVVSTPALMKKVSPTALLLMIESGRISGELSQGDILRVEQLAESFECARSYEDAYQLRRFVFLQAIATSRRHTETGTVSGRALVNVLRSANNAAAYKEAAAFVKQEWLDNQDHVGETPITRCVQQSYLGSMFRARMDLRSAEHYCRLAFDGISALLVNARANLDGPASSQSERGRELAAGWLMITTNQVVTWGNKPPSVDAICPFGSSVLHQIHEQCLLYRVLGWCLNTLTEDGFWKTILPVTPDMWLLAPNDVELAAAESTLLFFYLFSQMQPGQFVTQTSRSDSVELHASCVLEFAQVWGFRFQKLYLLLRTPSLSSIVLLNLARSLHSRDALRRLLGRCIRVTIPGKREVVTLRSVVCDIVENNVHLELEVSAVRDPRFQDRFSQVSMSPSFSPTMLSTPRSSWSGFRSFKSIARRGSTLWANTNNSNNDVRSLLSSRRWSRASSTKSAATLPSMMISDYDDAIMEDDADLPG